MALKREREAMPDDIKRRLEELELMEAYNSRPPYQQNDYLRWISFAKQATAREKRIQVVLEELKDGTTYMNMAWNLKR